MTQLSGGRTVRRRDNVILIGMSGAGKSTLGVLLAKALGKSFVDTDLLIQQREEKLLQQILNEKGQEYFMEIEEDVISTLSAKNSVVATGGSVVYSDRGMKHLREIGFLVYLQVEDGELLGRISNITTRGIVFKGSGDFRSVYEERKPLYEKYADLTVNCSGGTVERSVERILTELSEEKK